MKEIKNNKQKIMKNSTIHSVSWDLEYDYTIIDLDTWQTEYLWTLFHIFIFPMQMKRT